jgi:hypothetical protein
MTYGCFDLAKDQELQNRVRAELQELAAQHAATDDILTNKELETLPYFNAFLREVLASTLRCPVRSSALFPPTAPCSAALPCPLAPRSPLCPIAFTATRPSFPTR